MKSHSAVQQVLLLPEILRMVCDELEYRGDLFSVALTSRAFCEHALDELWRSITSFEPIVACLAEDLWIREESREIAMLSLARALLPDDVHRYKSHYAHRIRVIGLDGPGVSTILSLSVFQALQLAIGPEHGALSPQLNSLNWIGGHILSKCGDKMFSEIFPMLALFVGKNVETLAFHLPDPNDHIQTTSIWSTACRLPNLKNLSIFSLEPASYQADKHLNCSSWSQLAWLRIPITDGAITQLASLPHLTRLEVFYQQAIPIYSSVRTATRFSSEENFPSLKTLEVTSESLPSLTTFLRYLPPTNGIQSLVCGANAIASLPDSQRLLEAVESHCNPDTLKELILLDNSEPVDDSAPRPSHDRIDISSLFKFKRLTELMVYFTEGLWITSEEARQIPKAWSNIETLCLDLANRRIPRIDHKDLLNIVYNCRSLRYLSLPFDATKVEGAERDLCPGNGVIPALNELDVGYSPISSASRVIQLFAVHCSKLKRVMSHANDSDYQYRGQWEFVDEHF